MDNPKTEMTVALQIDPDTTTVIGNELDFVVEDIGIWADPAFNYSKGRVGVRAHPHNSLRVRIPVTGNVNPNEPITPVQLSEVVASFMETLMPACKILVTSAAEEFGYVEPPPPLEGDF